MPWIPRRPCPVCGELTTEGRCKKHRVQTLNRVKRSRPAASKREYDYAWQEFREEQLAKRTMCEASKGCRRRATELHHVIRLVDGGAKLDPHNTQALCGADHDALGGKGGRA